MNLDFHSLIYEASGNVDLAEMSSELRLKLAPYRKSQLFQIDRLRASNLEHELIVRLLGAGNKPGVEEALRAHLNGARHAALKVRE
ncbi:MAG: FCD domain-containing protein, partial [Pseudomonadota bacterium]